jgi:hypothetical protein
VNRFTRVEAFGIALIGLLIGIGLGLGFGLTAAPSAPTKIVHEGPVYQVTPLTAALMKTGMAPYLAACIANVVWFWMPVSDIHSIHELEQQVAAGNLAPIEDEYRYLTGVEDIPAC